MERLAHISDAGPLAILLVFFVLHLFIGAFLPYRKADKPFLWNLMQGAAGELDRRLNRITRTDSERFTRGLVATLVMGAFALVLGYAVHHVGQMPYGWLADLLFLSTAITVMAPIRLAQEIIKHPARAAAQLQPFFKEKLSSLDGHAQVRKAVELQAVRINQHFIAPVIFYIFAGTPGLAVYVTFVALYDAYGLPDPQHLFFGSIARGMEKMLNFIPARLSAVAIVFAGLFVPRAHPAKGLHTALRQADAYRPTNAGWLVAAAAGTLGVTLGGPIRYEDGHLDENKWIGPTSASAKARPEHLKKMALLHFIIFLIVMTILALWIIAKYKYT